MRVIWSPAALREIERIYRYIAQFNPHAATNLANQILAAGDSLERLPLRGRVVLGTQLREPTISYPYIIRYRVAADYVRILRVRHGAPRNPDRVRKPEEVVPREHRAARRWEKPNLNRVIPYRLRATG